MLRAGVAHGAAIGRGGDFYGPPVNLASRITAVARPGSVLADKEAKEALGDRFHYSFAGERRLKGHLGRGEAVPGAARAQGRRLVPDLSFVVVAVIAFLAPGACASCSSAFVPAIVFELIERHDGRAAGARHRRHDPRPWSSSRRSAWRRCSSSPAARSRSSGFAGRCWSALLACFGLGFLIAAGMAAPCTVGLIKRRC